MKISSATAHANGYHALANGAISIGLSPMGAELMSLRSEQNGLEYLWQGDATFWGRRSPLLFPIVGRLKNDTYTYRGSTYHMPQHGLARTMRFELADKSTTNMSFVLRSNDETLKYYPFAFELMTEYALDGETLRVVHEVRNPDTEPMLFSIGAHPGFRCPLKPGERYEDYRIAVDTPLTLARHSIEDGLIAKHSEPFLVGAREFGLSRSIFDRGAIVFKNIDIQRLRLFSMTTGHGVVMETEGFPYLGIWAKAGADFVCLEPWHGIADGVDSSGRLEEKEGIIRLEGTSSFRTSYTITPG